MTPLEASLKKNHATVYETLYGNYEYSPGIAKYKVGDFVRTSVDKGAFEKESTAKWTTEVFQITKVQLTNPVTYHISDLKGEEILGSFYEPELQPATKPATKPAKRK